MEFQKKVSSFSDGPDGLASALDELRAAFLAYKKTIPPVMDTFLSPGGLLTKKREIADREASLRASIERSRERIRTWQADTAALETEIDSLRETIKGMEIRLATIKAGMDSFRTVKENMERGIEEKEMNLVDTRSTITITENRIAAVNDQLRAADREKAELLFFSGVSGKKRADKLEIDLYDPQVAQLLDSEEKHRQLIDDVELLSAGREMDMQAVRDGQLSPVFFGSALTNFGIEPFLEAFLKLTPPPLARTADCGVIDPFSPDFSAFVFKIQANMNKAHRDRLAFMRICSGKFQRDAEYFHVQGNKKMRLSQPQQLMAAEREIVDEAYAGDVIGVFDPGIFSIGDTITVPGKKFKYSGIPTFAPEHFCRVSAKDSMKRKQFVKGTEQIAQEGAIQIFKVPGSGYEEVIVGVVGTLQFDVFQYRMKNEYGVDLRMDMLPYEEIRLIDEYPGDLTDLNLGSDAELLEDYRGRSLLVFSSFWAIDFTCRRNPGLKVSEIVVAEG